VHAGIGAGLVVDTRSHTAMPAKGVFYTLDLRAMQQMRGEKTSFGAIRANLSLFTRLSADSGIVLVNRAGGGTTVGDPAFYQMMQLGGPLNLRGYNLNRFTGRSMLYHNAELRLKLFSFTSYLFPGTFGLIGFNDVGRVWIKNERSDTWHHGYGGGIYIVPANVVLIRALLGCSREGNQFYFNFLYGL
jgi:outer membrane translocation and assembly module TamA